MGPHVLPTTGWGGSGQTTITYTPSGVVLAPTGSPGNAITFSITLDPVDSKVRAGSYSADGTGSGLTITAGASNAPSVNTTVDLEGLVNLVVSNGTGTWSRTRTTRYYVGFTTTVRNRGRVATGNLQVALSENFPSYFRSEGGNNSSVAGWAYTNTNSGTNGLFDKDSQLAAKSEVTLTASLRYNVNVNGNAPAGIVTLTPNDASYSDEGSTPGQITVGAKTSGW